MSELDSNAPIDGPGDTETASWTVAGGNGNWRATSPRGAWLDGFPSEEGARTFAGHMDGVQRALDAANIDWGSLFRPPPKDLDEPGPLRVVR